MAWRTGPSSGAIRSTLPTLTGESRQERTPLACHEFRIVLRLDNTAGLSLSLFCLSLSLGASNLPANPIDHPDHFCLSPSPTFPYPLPPRSARIIASLRSSTCGSTSTSGRRWRSCSAARRAASGKFPSRGTATLPPTARTPPLSRRTPRCVLTEINTDEKYRGGDRGPADQGPIRDNCSDGLWNLILPYTLVICFVLRMRYSSTRIRR